jgi:cytochrome c-type biogenesis protein CcmH/NrfG
MTEKKEIKPGYIKKETMLIAILIALGVGFLGGATLSSFKFKQEETQSIQRMPQQAVQQENKMTPELANKISTLEMKTSSNPEDAGAWAQLGNLYFDSKQFGEAINAYKKSLELEPNNPDVWTDLGVMYRRNGQPIQAVEAFDKAVEFDPSHEIARLNKGIVLMHDLNDIQGAIAVWEELVKVNPDAKTSTGQLIKDVISGFKARESQQIPGQGN